MRALDHTGAVESFNSVAETIFGWPENEILGKDISVLAPQSDVVTADQFTTHFLASEDGLAVTNKRLEMTMCRRDGSLLPVEVSLSARHSGGHARTTGIIRDITEQKAQQAALTAARERELRMGHDIQQILLFGEPLQVAGVEISAFTQPSQGVDGDFFEFFSIEPECFDVLSGDVMGKGVAAALLGAALKHQYNRIMAEQLAPALLNGRRPTPESIINCLHNRFTPELQRLESFIALAFVRVDLQNNQIRYLNGGHPEGVLFGKNGQVTILKGGHLPIGVALGEQYISQAYPFCAGDLLLLYSDGVSEARNANSELLGNGPVINLVQSLHAKQIPPAIILQRIRQVVDLHEKSHNRSDDFTTIGIYRHAENVPASREFPRKMAVLTKLREWLKKLLVLTDTVADALELAAVEVATNIIRHVAEPLADTPFVVRLTQREEGLLVDFYYAGDGFNPESAAPPDFSGQREGGFGIYIIEQCVDKVEYLNPAEQVNMIRLHLLGDHLLVSARDITQQ